MRTLRLLASLPVALFLIFINPGNATEDLEGPQQPQVHSGGDLLNFLARPETTVQEGIEASADLFKKVLSDIIKDKETVANVKRAITITVSQLTDRSRILAEMNRIAETLKEGGLDSQKRDELLERLKELASQFKQRNHEMLAEGLSAIGLSKEEVEDVITRNGLLSQFTSLLENTALGPFQKHFEKN